MHIQWNKEWTTPALVGVGSFVAGIGAGALGYRTWLNRQIASVFEDVEEGHYDSDVYIFNTQREAEDLERFSVPDSTDLDIEEDLPEAEESCEIETNDPVEELDEGLIERFVDGVNRDIGHAEKEASEEHPFLINVFDNVPDWDQEAEDANRTTDAPYILHEDEFFADEKGYHQSAITYYVGDEILADENNVPIYNFESVTGPLLFGRGSHDPNCVYIRNDKTKAEWEITRHPGHYQIEIMGLHAEEEAEEDEIKHSQRIPRFRME